MGKYVDDDVHLASVLFGGIQHIHHRPRLALKRYLENRYLSPAKLDSWKMYSAMKKI